MGAASFKALKNHPKVHDRIKYSERSVVTSEMLAQLFGFDRVLVGDSVYSSDAGVFTDIWVDNTIVAYVPQLKELVDRTYYEPAFAYTLRKKGYPVIDSYEESGKVLILRNTDIFIPKVVGIEAAYLINDTNT